MSALPDAIHRRLARDGRAEDPSPDAIARLVRQAEPLLGEVEVARTAAAVAARLVGLGPIDDLLRDAATTDVLVNGPGPVWVERAGSLEPTDVVLDPAEVDLLVQRIVAPLGRRADPVHALVDARLPDGSRVHVAMPPVAVDGPYLAIRRFGARTVAVEEFAEPEVAALLRDLVERRANLVVSGATGSGKTTLLNALAAGLPAGLRVVTVEEAAELRLATRHVVRLETRPEREGVPEVSARDLVRHALRMRPDRIVLGEVRGEEAFDLLAALGTGHDGSMSTVHADDAAHALVRLTTLVLLAGTGLPHAAAQQQVRDAIDVVVHVARLGEARRVVEVLEVRRPPAGGSAVLVELVRGGRVRARPDVDRRPR